MDERRTIFGVRTTRAPIRVDAIDGIKKAIVVPCDENMLKQIRNNPIAQIIRPKALVFLKMGTPSKKKVCLIEIVCKDGEVIKTKYPDMNSLFRITGKYAKDFAAVPYNNLTGHVVGADRAPIDGVPLAEACEPVAEQLDAMMCGAPSLDGESAEEVSYGPAITTITRLGDTIIKHVRNVSTQSVPSAPSQDASTQTYIG